MSRATVSLDQKSAWMRERHAPSEKAETAPGLVIERYYTVGEVSEVLKMSQDWVRKTFQTEPGVLVIGDGGTPHKRKYVTLRIPESVVRRVIHRMSNPPGNGHA